MPSSDDRDALRALLTERFGHDIDVPDDVQGIAALLRIAGHTTHRSWSDRPVSADTVRLLAACALSAPSKSYLQQADIVDVRDPARRTAIQALLPTLPWVANAPALLVFCANGRRFRRLFTRRGLAFTNENLDGFFNPTVDAALVMMNFLNAAEAAGLVGCPLSLVRNEPFRLADVLELPRHVVPVAGLCIGHPTQVRSINPRLPLDACLHVDRIGDQDDDPALDDFDRRYVAARRAVLPADAPPPRTWSEERTEQYAQAHRADWAAFVRAQGFDPE